MTPAGTAIAAGRVPVLATVDCAIAGATCGGLALALALARRGMKVAVLEPRTSPGWEFSALLRPWLAATDADAPPDLFTGWLAEARGPEANGEVALVPDALKRGLEHTVLEAGIDLLYAVPAIGLIHEDARIAGLVVAHKSGRRAVLAGAVVDATDWAVLGRLAAPKAFTVRRAETAEARRTLEFTRVGATSPAAVASLRELAGIRQAVLHRGHTGLEHALVELVLDLPLEAADLAGRMTAEIAARRLSIAAVERLRAAVPGFERARLAHASWVLHRASPWRLAGAAGPEVPGAPGLFLCSTAVAPDRATATALLDPVAAARAGGALADAVEQSVRAAPPPDPARRVARCAGAAAEGGRQARDAEPDAGPEWVALRAEMVPLLAAAQVLVAGGGTSGATAAAVAAGQGVRTVLLEMNDGLGGSGTVGGVDSYWYGRRVGFTREVDDRTRAVAERLGTPSAATWNIEAKMHALLEWATEAGCEVYFGCVAVAALLDGDRITGVLAATPDGLRAVTAAVTIDASGDGDVAAAAGAPFVYGAERDGMPMWTLLAPVPEPGKPSNHFTSAADVRDVRDYTRAIVSGRQIMPGHDHGAYLAPRESRHIRGGVVLGIEDHLLLRSQPDAINICFSNCDIKGRSDSDWVGFGILPPNAELEIPYRAVVPEGVEGLLVAGKAYSCTHDFLATARMQADLQNQGGAIALAAAQAVATDVTPRGIEVPVLQAALRRRGVLPAGWTHRPGDGRPSRAEWPALVDGLTGEEPMIVDQGFDDVSREPFTIVRLCAADEGIIPLLVAAHQSAQGARRLLLARLLAWHRSAEGVPTLIAAFEGQVGGGSLPAITRAYRYAGIPPDNGIMPEPCYLLHALKMTGDPRVVPLLGRVTALWDPPVEAFRSRTDGAFHYADTVCQVAERLEDPRAVAALLELASRAAIRGRVHTAPEPDFILDRLAYLELCTGRALARCGSDEGRRLLQAYAGDGRALFARMAREELKRFRGSRG